jgi:UDP:flavonoid glycosyltransferase YjiC (YdhE family)
VFARAAAVVHQGGIGTTSNVLRAGKPMIIVPFAHDQTDNAARVAALGVGRVLQRDEFEAGRVATELERLLGDAEACARAAALGQRIGAEDGVATACELLEARLRGSTRVPSRLPG